MSARILVTGSSLFFTARLIHDLGRRGARITAADSLRFSAGKSSRFVSRTLKVPPVSTDPGGFLQAITNELHKRSYDLLLPTFEEALLLSEYQDELRPLTQLFLPPFKAMNRLHNKPRLHNFCLAHGLPTPPTLNVRSPQNLENAGKKLGFPVVLKLPAGNNSVGRMFCNNPQELDCNFRILAAAHELRPAELPFVQKRIEGELICTLCFCSQGRKLGEIVYRTGRMFPEAGGTAAHRQSIRHPQISQIMDRMISATQWSGFLGVDFLVEKESGIPFVIDANTRANPAIHLGFMAGVDWSQLILDLVAGKEPEVQSAEPGVNAHNLLLDLSWLLEGLLPRAGGIGRFPQRMLRFVSPGWKVHSRGDLLGLNEYGSLAALTANALSAGVRSLATGRQTGHLLLEHANYDPAAAADYRAQRSAALHRSVSTAIERDSNESRRDCDPIVKQGNLEIGQLLVHESSR